MKHIIGILLLLNCSAAFSQPRELTGTYISVCNLFERWSIMTLNEDYTFSYDYGVGGCQATVTGAFSVDGATLRFENDQEFLHDTTTDSISTDSIEIDLSTPFYPNLALTKWKIGKHFIKPLDEVDTGCLRVIEKHKRK